MKPPPWTAPPRIKKLLRIILPCLLPTVIIMFIMRRGNLPDVSFSLPLNSIPFSTAHSSRTDSSSDIGILFPAAIPSVNFSRR